VRVALIVPGGLDPSGEARTIPALMWLTERLARRHELEVFSLRQLDRPRAFEVRGVPVWDMGLAGHAGSARAALALRRCLARLRSRPPFDVFHGCWLGLPGLLAIIGGGLQRRPTVISIMGTELAPARRNPATRRLAARAVLRRAARVTVGSRFLAAHAARLGVRPEIVPLGVEATWFEDAAAPPGPPWRLLHVASLNPWKDQVTLLKAVAELVRRDDRVHLDVVGEDTMRGAMAREAAALGLGRFVTFHGFVPSGSLGAFYRRAHLLLLPSRYEAQGVVVLEAAAHGVPTVGTAVGLVADGDGDWTVAVPVGDPGALARAVVAVLEDPVRREALGARAARWAREHDADWTAARFEGIYARCADQRSRRVAAPR